MSRTVHGPDALPRLRQHESIRGGLRRVLLGCIGRAGQAMADESGPLTARVHEARIALKRARAVLRLGDACGLAWTALARYRLARLAGELAAVRDAAVVAETARQFGAAVDVAEAGPGSSWTAWAGWLAAECAALTDCPWPVLWRRDCVAALAHSVRRLHKQEQTARHGAKARRLHAWRKTVIVLREQLNVLRPLLTPRQQGYATRLHRLARKLGAAQDLALLIAAERRRVPDAARRVLLAHAHHERRQTVRRVRRLAKGQSKALRWEFDESD